MFFSCFPRHLVRAEKQVGLSRSSPIQSADLYDISAFPTELFGSEVGIMSEKFKGAPFETYASSP